MGYHRGTDHDLMQFAKTRLFVYVWEGEALVIVKLDTKPGTNYSACQYFSRQYLYRQKADDRPLLAFTR